MTEAFVFDAIRTPRGKGKKDGSLHEVKPINLLAGLLTDLQQRHQFDTALVDDVVMGVVSPVGDQGSVIPKVAALKAGWDFRASGVQINRNGRRQSTRASTSSRIRSARTTSTSKHLKRCFSCPCLSSIP